MRAPTWCWMSSSASIRARQGAYENERGSGSQGSVPERLGSSAVARMEAITAARWKSYEEVLEWL